MGDVKVFFRKRPFTGNDGKNDKDILKITDNYMILDDNRPRIKQEVTKKKFKREENLTFVAETIKNNSLYQDNFYPDIEKFLTGNTNGLLILAYGQTGSGKTHTIMGSQSEPGLLQCYFKQLFDNKHTNTRILLSSFEIYNENISDLIHHKYKLKPWFSIMDYKNCCEIKNMTDVAKYLDIINRNKIMGSTKINKNSSRSHTIYKIDVNGKTIIFIDLAGNERGKVSVANNRLLMQEAANINLSLFALKECIRSLREHHKYIPFRSSKLTIVLRDIFQRGFDIRFIATLNPSVLQFHDTLDTIRYAISLSYSDLKQIEVFEEDKVVKDPLHKLYPEPKNNIVVVPKLEYKPEIKQHREKDVQKSRGIKYLDPVKKEAEQNNKDKELDDDYFEGFRKEYFDYIMEFNKLIRNDQRLFKKGNLSSISDRELSRNALTFLLDKRDFLKQKLDIFCKYAGIDIKPNNKKVLEPISKNKNTVFSNTV